MEISEIDGRLSEEYETRLQQSLQELRDQYEEQMQVNRSEIEHLYETKVRSSFSFCCIILTISHYLEMLINHTFAAEKFASPISKELRICHISDG